MIREISVPAEYKPICFREPDQLVSQGTVEVKSGRGYLFQIMSFLPNVQKNVLNSVLNQLRVGSNSVTIPEQVKGKVAVHLLKCVRVPLTHFIPMLLFF